MVIKTQYGNEVTPTEAIFDELTGDVTACFARRVVDNQVRFYELRQLRAPGGIAELVAALEMLPKRADSAVLAHETW